jgi:hypothetical protein
VDTGFPKGNATNIESRALSCHRPCDLRVNLNGKRSRRDDTCDARLIRSDPAKQRPAIPRERREQFYADAARSSDLAWQ